MSATLKCPKCGTKYRREPTSGLRLCPNRKCGHTVPANPPTKVLTLNLPDTEGMRKMLDNLALHAIEDEVPFLTDEAEEQGRRGAEPAAKVAEVRELAKAYEQFYGEVTRQLHPETCLQVGQKMVFKTPFDQYKEYDGMACQVKRVIDKPDAEHDVESLPMYEVAILTPRGRITIEAWPEELKV